MPPGDQKKLFERIRQVGQGYTIIGTNYTYNSRDQLIHRENLIRYEDYDYKYDDAGNLLTDGRSKYEWNARGQLTKVTFPDGFGEKYTYDMLGRRVTKTDFNHQGETQQTTTYHYKGDTWNLTQEVVNGDDGDGESSKSYTYDANGRPLSITFKGETFWYVYNGHGDVVALTDKDGQVAARYEYDAWGLVTGMYNRYGERVREGIGWMGDLGSGSGSPGSLQGPEDSSGNTVPDYEPGNGQVVNDTSSETSTGTDNSKGNNGVGNGDGGGKENNRGNGGKDKVSVLSVYTEPTTDLPVTTDDAVSGTSELDSLLTTTDEEPTADITTDLVKENPFRYAGYYWDRKTQYYYLQARYYDPRPARFISEDTYEGEIENPQSLNQYVYAENNPLSYVDPTGRMTWATGWYLSKGFATSIWDGIADLGKTLDSINPSNYNFYTETLPAAWEFGKAIYKGQITISDLKSGLQEQFVAPFEYLDENYKNVFEGSPTHNEAYQYGYNAGESFQLILGAASLGEGLAAKLASKSPKLFKLLTKARVGRPITVAKSLGISSRVVRAGEDVWKLAASPRGYKIDELLGNNLGPRFPVADRLSNRNLISFKSIDPNASSYSKGFYSKVKSDIDSLYNFKGRNWEGTYIDESYYDTKTLDLSLPDVKLNDAQIKSLQQLKDYATNKKIKFTLTIVTK